MEILTGTTAADPRPSEARVLVQRVSAWLFVRVELRGEDAAVHSGVRDACVARLDLGTGALTAFVVVDLVGALLETEPLLRVTRDGVGLDVIDADSRRAGERLLRWRIELERFRPQLGEASP
jgi:hypothetical protein